jgi:hypothetical protein
MTSTGGGEEIFESVGETAEVVQHAAQLEDAVSEEIDMESVDASEAFAVFNGQVYVSSSSRGGERMYSAADSNEAQAESPIQRFTRLKSELGALMADVEIMRAEAKAKDEGATLWSVLQQETKKTIDSLCALDGAAELQAGGGGANGAAQLDLLVQKLSVSDVDSDAADGAVVTPRSSASVTELEKRLFTLESMLGTTSNLLDIESVGDGYEETRGSVFPLVDCVARMERRVDTLDERTLESIRNKAIAVQSELEAMNREKGRGASVAEQKAMDAAAAVDDLVKRAKRADAVAKEVPPLLVRLKTLEGTHVAATTFAQRLETLEVAVNQTSDVVSENGEILKTLRQSITSSISIFKDNIDRVDARIESLS